MSPNWNQINLILPNLALITLIWTKLTYIILN